MDPIPDEELLNMSSEVYSRGWDVVKLYFMIGLPTERDDDILAIADLARRTWAKGRAINKNARVNLGVSTFVPKPFTPVPVGCPDPSRRDGTLPAASAAGDPETSGKRATHR